VWAGTMGMDDWRYWHAQGFTFWISAGPLMSSTTPDPCDLGRLIEESKTQRAPTGE
jgi:hypothetical protein